MRWPGALALVAGLALPAAALMIAKVDQVEALIVDRTNEFRRQNGAEPLRRDASLQKAAERFAAYMARTGEYGHEADGSTAGRRARAAGYGWCDISENIAYQFDSRGFEADALARKVLDGWKASPGHRANMLDRAVLDTAVAVARSERTGYFYSVQMFGRRC